MLDLISIVEMCPYNSRSCHTMSGPKVCNVKGALIIAKIDISFGKVILANKELKTLERINRKSESKERK